MALLAIVVVLPGRERRRSPQPVSVRDVGRVITRRDVLLPSMFAALVMHADWTVTFGFLPILAKQLGAASVTQSVLLTMYFALCMAGNLVATALARRVGARRLIYASFFLLSIGVGTAAVAYNMTTVFAAQLCIGLGQGICYPVLLGMSIAKLKGAERATAMGLHQSLYAVGMFSGPWLSGMLAQALDIRPMFGITAVACLVLSLLLTPWFAQGRQSAPVARER